VCRNSVDKDDEMKKLIAMLILLVSVAGAINWDYPEELALDCRNSLEAFLNAYENACIDSISVGGVSFVMPTEIRNYWRAVAQTERANFVTAWGLLNAYILNGG
jgi:hypothetical protein